LGARKFVRVLSERRRIERPSGLHDERRNAMSYVDGFVLAVPKDNIDAYKELARKAGEVWMEHGATAYVEAIGDDVPYGELTSSPAPYRRRKTRSWSFRGSPIRHARNATRRWEKSWPTRASKAA
jgi:uncharacterized protein YbaA (DUF1428 family)